MTIKGILITVIPLLLFYFEQTGTIIDETVLLGYITIITAWLGLFFVFVGLVRKLLILVNRHKPKPRKKV